MITLDKIRYSYPKGVEALSGVSARIGSGIHLLLGENGAGKTTLLHLIAGLLIPQDGTCSIDGVETCKRFPQTMARLFFLPDDMNLGRRSVDDLVACHAPFYPTFSRELLDECLGRFGLSADVPLRDMSFGNRRKCCLSYALALRTSVLLLDEPANGLDIESKRELQTLLASSVNEDQTVIISTHTVQDLKNLYDGVIVMNHGHIQLAETVGYISDRLAFALSATRRDDALYSEREADGWHLLMANDGSVESDVDFRLLYAALHGDKAADVLNCLCNDEKYGK